MKTRFWAILLAGLLGSSLSNPSISFAGGKGDKSELQAKLVPAGTVLVEDSEGKVKYKKKASKKGSEEEIEAKLESELPNPTLGINDENSAADASFLLKIFQGTTATLKGTCILLIKEIEFEYEGGTTLVGFEAEYFMSVWICLINCWRATSNLAARQKPTSSWILRRRVIQLER